MICVLIQYELPSDKASLAQYTSWVTGDGMKQFMALKGLRELRLYRDHSELSPEVVAMLFFQDLPSALPAASSEVWQKLVTNLTIWGSTGPQLRILEPSPLFPQPVQL